jgi:hypothetical protein
VIKKFVFFNGFHMSFCRCMDDRKRETCLQLQRDAGIVVGSKTQNVIRKTDLRFTFYVLRFTASVAEVVDAKEAYQIRANLCPGACPLC